MLDLDRELTLIQAGDARAFERWVRLSEPVIRGQLRRFATDVDTEAVLQETLLRVWQTAGRVAPDGRPNALLRFGSRVAQNLALSLLRGRRPQVEPAGEELAVAPREPDPHLALAARGCIEELPPQPRRALLARLGQGGGEDSSLAARMQMTLNTFLQNVTRARKLLVRCLSGKGIDLETCL